MRVLGIDPGLSRCGVGTVDGTAARARLVAVEVVQSDPRRPVAARLAGLHAALSALLARLCPDAVAVERVFFSGNAATATATTQAAGVALLCAAQAGIDVAEYTPTRVKAVVTGSGNADKDQVAYLVRASLGLDEAPRPSDAADALALALCHLQLGGVGDGASPAGLPPRLAAALADAGPGLARDPRVGPSGRPGSDRGPLRGPGS